MLDGSFVLVDARGAFVISPVQEALARRIAVDDFAGDGQPIATELVTTTGGDYRGRLPAWRVTFDDAESTRIYVADNDGRADRPSQRHLAALRFLLDASTSWTMGHVRISTRPG